MGRQQAIRLNDKELEIFQKNYRLMLDRLTVSAYELRVSKKDMYYGAEELPAYSTLSRCLYCADKNKESKDEAWYPTRAIVAKIVKFYNLNISPATDVVEFLSRDMSLKKFTLEKSGFIYSNSFINRYITFYLSPNGLHAGLLDIYVPGGREGDYSAVRATLVMGLRSDEMINSKSLLEYINALRKGVKPKAKTFDIDKEQCHVFTGKVDLTLNSLVAAMDDVDDKTKKLFLCLDTADFHKASRDRAYLGGMGYALSSNGPFGIRMMKIAMAEYGEFRDKITFSEPQLREQLNIIAEEGRPLTLKPETDKAWYDFLAAKRRGEL